MAAVEVTISGMLYDKLNRTMQNVVLIGEASLTGVGVGGGPVIPPSQPPGGGGSPPGQPAFPIWGPPGVDFPDKPGYPPTVGGGPIIPPNVPPGLQPPETPPAGSVTPVPPPAGSPGWPVHPMQPPDYIIVNYPGYGPVYVTPPASATPA